MDEIINELVEAITICISGFSWLDQAYMLTEIAERLKAEAHKCLEIEYGLREIAKLV